MPIARPESSDSRVIAHVDMDCFYVQVEQRKQPTLRGQPAAVVQYNSWKGGGLIAVSYEARKHGVKRSMRGDDAKHVCPQIQLVQVPVARGKADLSTYRNAGSEVVSILARKGLCERASIDEVYLDLTVAAEAMLSETPPESLMAINEEALKSHVLGLNEDGGDVKQKVKEWLCRRDADHRDKLLACGAHIVAELRLQVLEETEFTCSAGIAHNKMLAKLASGMNKPAQQTVVPLSSVKGLLGPLPIKKMKQLGGKLGSSLQVDLGVNTVGDLLQFSEEKLQERYGISTGTWLWSIARGISGEEVEGRLLPKSHGSGKTFPGPQSLKTLASVKQWLNELCDELSERLQSDLEQNKRIAHTLTLHARAYTGNDSDLHTKFPSKSCPLRYGTAKVQEDALNLFQAGLRDYLGSHSVKPLGSQHHGWGITGLSVSASKIVAIPSGTSSITKYFHGQDQSHFPSKKLNGELLEEVTPSSPSGSACYSEYQQNEPKMECHAEETGAKNIMQRLDEQKYEGNARNEQDSSCSSLKQVEDLFTQKTSPGSFSGIITESPGEGSSVKDVKRVVNLQERKRKIPKEKGTSSILRFFQTQHSSSFPKHDNIDTSNKTEASSDGLPSIGTSYSKPTEDELTQETRLAENASTSGTYSSWRYNIDEIDPTVVDELPSEIQEEIRAWIRPHKRTNNSSKRGQSIANYFLPTKNS